MFLFLCETILIGIYSRWENAHLKKIFKKIKFLIRKDFWYFRHIYNTLFIFAQNIDFTKITDK